LADPLEGEAGLATRLGIAQLQPLRVPIRPN
jgi:hypothetical protein